jgi:hypothetical protein
LKLKQVWFKTWVLMLSITPGKLVSMNVVDGFFGHLAGLKPRNSRSTGWGIMYAKILARTLDGRPSRRFVKLDDAMASADSSDL